MTLANSTAISLKQKPDARDRSRSSADVNRWVAMIDAEIRSDEDTNESLQDSVAVTIEFGRGTVDTTAEPPRPGVAYKLDQLADEPLDVIVDGRPIARGELVVVDGQIGVRIVELLMFVVAWFAINLSPGLADDRTGVFTFDNESERLEAPFGTVRGSGVNFDFGDTAEISTKRVDEPQKSGAPPLRPRSDVATQDTNRSQAPKATGWSATVWPLLLVVGLIVAGARWMKARTSPIARGLPSEAFEIIGRKAIDPRTSIVLARCGSKLLVLSLSPHGLQTLSEITDPVEIDCLDGLCRSTHQSQTLAETFRSMLRRPSTSKSTGVVFENSHDPRIAERTISARSTPPLSEVHA